MSIPSQTPPVHLDRETTPEPDDLAYYVAQAYAEEAARRERCRPLTEDEEAALAARGYRDRPWLVPADGVHWPGDVQLLDRLGLVYGRPPRVLDRQTWQAELVRLLDLGRSALADADREAALAEVLGRLLPPERWLAMLLDGLAERPDAAAALAEILRRARSRRTA